MKKILIVFSIILLACSTSVGQNYRYLEEDFARNTYSDGFFSSNSNTNRDGVNALEWGNMPIMPGTHGYILDHTARVPLGSGALLLGAFGLGYALKKRNSRKK